MVYTSSSFCKTMALVISFGQLLTVVSSTSSPEDWASYSYALHSEESRYGDSFTSAYLNVTHEDPETGLLVSDKTEVGRYGGGYIGPAAGYVIHVRSDQDADDHTGCQMPLRSSFGGGKLPANGEPWIALIKRGKCNFEVKVDNAYKSNAVAVLVYNDRDSATLDKMKLAPDNGSKLIFIDVCLVVITMHHNLFVTKMSLATRISKSPLKHVKYLKII